MPIPIPKGKDEKHLDMGECIRFLRKERPDMEANQRVAVCFSVWRKAHGKSEPKKE